MSHRSKQVIHEHAATTKKCRFCTGILDSAGECRIICGACAVATGTEWVERCYLTDMEK